MRRSNRPLETPTFAQTFVLVRDVIRSQPTACSADLTELVKRRHLELGFRYAPDQIHRAFRAVEYVTAPSRPSNRPSGRSM
jgi:hypothetical protein